MGDKNPIDELPLPIYEEGGEDDGRVKDPEIAHEMALVMDDYYKKLLGIIPAWKARIEKGERLAEAKIREGNSVTADELPECIKKGIREESHNEYLPEVNSARKASFADGIDVYVLTLIRTIPQSYPTAYARHLEHTSRKRFAVRGDKILHTDSKEIGIKDATSKTGVYDLW